MSIIKDMITESDGISFCPARALLILGALAFLGLAIYTALQGKPFDPQSFGLGYGGLLGGGGAGIALKGRVGMKLGPTKRLTDEEKIRIRKLYYSGVTQRELRERFGVAQATISYIIRQFEAAIT